MSMLLLTDALRAAAVPGFARAVAVFSFAVALSTQPVRRVLQRRPPLRYCGLLMVKLGSAQGRWGLVLFSLGARLSLAFGPIDALCSREQPPLRWAKMSGLPCRPLRAEGELGTGCAV